MKQGFARSLDFMSGDETSRGALPKSVEPATDAFMTSRAGSAEAASAFDLIIFDCDGVLVDSERIAARLDSQILTELGWPISEAEVIERFMGKSHQYFVSQVEAQLGLRLPADWEVPFQQRFHDAWTSELKTVPGLVEALDVIMQRPGLATCVASSGGHDKMRVTLGATGLYPRFAGRIFSATEVEHGKPAPDLFLYAAARMGIEPRRCAVVEDSRFGVEAGRAAKMHVFAYAGGLLPRSALEGPGTTVFDDMAQLPRLLTEHPSTGR